VRTVPLRDEHGNIVKWFGTSTEIEDRKQAEDALRCSLEELRALAARLQSVREEERTRVAREIHDELGQALTGIKLESASLIRELAGVAKQQSNRAEFIAKLADETIHAVRRIATELRPGILDDMGLAAAVEWVAEEFQARTGTKVQLTLPEVDLTIGRECATALFRILQEILTNVARHANATQVNVRLVKEQGSLILEVHDNGKGVSKEELSAGRSLGILGMRERALLLGGKLAISGAPAFGTTVTVRIPGGLPS
jgi:signal transduction histidine kinase